MMTTQKICEDALEENEEKLSGLPNVIGIGVVSLDESDPGSENLGIAVYVEKKVSEHELLKEEIVPKKIQIMHGGTLKEVSVRVIEQGKVTLEPSDDDSGFSIDLL